MRATATTSKIVPAGTNRAMSPATPGLAVQLVTAGSAACVADLITFPLDTAKVRLQVQGECLDNVCSIQRGQPKFVGVFGTVRGIALQEGPNIVQWNRTRAATA